MDWPTLSVILTTRDRPSLLPVALACYRQQTYPNKELIVVDDGDRFPVDPSTVEAVGGRLIRVAPGTTLGAKLNQGVEAAQGRLCQKMDDDDWYAPDFLVSMVSGLMQDHEVCRPSFAFMMPFLFFELARWEIRRSISTNVPGATLLFYREDWVHRPFRRVRFDEDTWFVLDRLKEGLRPVPVACLESFLAIRHSGGTRDRGHTWIHQADGKTLESYLQERPLYHRSPEDLLPQWAIDIYRKLGAIHGETKGWLRHVAFQSFSEPERMAVTDVERLASLFGTPSVDQETLEHAGQALNFLISSPQAAASIDALVALLRKSTLASAVYKTLLQSLQYAVTWRRPLLDPEELAQLAALDHLRLYRRFLLQEILEPCLFGAPATVTSRQLDGASPTCLYALGQPVQFELHDEVARRLQVGPKRVLMVHNIDDAQGDQILRTVPLLQALLDFNPQLEVTLLGNRTYLYSHPRITAIDIRTDGASSAIDPPYDV